MLHQKISTSTLSKNARKKQYGGTNGMSVFLLKEGHVLKRDVATLFFFRRRKAQKNSIVKMLHGNKNLLHPLSKATMNVTFRVLKWFFLLVLLYLVLGIAILLVQDGMSSVMDIIVYGIMGFVTFFMGYLGWYIARDVIVVVSGKIIKNEDPEL